MNDPGARAAFTASVLSPGLRNAVSWLALAGCARVVDAPFSAESTRALRKMGIAYVDDDRMILTAHGLLVAQWIARQ